MFLNKCNVKKLSESGHLPHKKIHIDTSYQNFENSCSKSNSNSEKNDEKTQNQFFPFLLNQKEFLFLSLSRIIFLLFY